MHIALVKPRIPVFAFDGRVGEWGIDAVRAAIEGGLVALIIRVRNEPAGKIRRITLKASAGTIAKPSPQSTVVKVLPMTHTHRSSLAAGF